MKSLIAYSLSIIFSLLAAIHIYWGFGGKSGSAASIPIKTDGKPIIKPGKTDCFAVALGLFIFGIFVLVKSGIILLYLPAWLFNYGMWLIALLFLLRAIGEFKYIGFFKKIKTTRFGQMDTMYYSPLCLAIAVLSTILNLMA